MIKWNVCMAGHGFHVYWEDLCNSYSSALSLIASFHTCPFLASPVAPEVRSAWIEEVALTHRQGFVLVVTSAEVVLKTPTYSTRLSGVAWPPRVTSSELWLQTS